MRPVKAVYVSSEDQPVSIPLTVYVGPDPDHDLATSDRYGLKLWDFTLRAPRNYTREGERVNETLDGLLRQFADDAPYPDGHIRFEVLGLLI